MSELERGLRIGFVAGMCGAAVYKNELPKEDFIPKIKETLQEMNQAQLSEIELLTLSRLLADMALFVLTMKEASKQ